MKLPTSAVHSSATGGPAYTATFSRQPASASHARRLVSQALQAWGLSDLTSDGILIVGELVNNAIQHARGADLRVTISRIPPSRVRIAVIDKSRLLPTPRTAAETDEDGRGLTLIAELAVAIGVKDLRWGKRVWADLSTNSESPADGRTHTRGRGTAARLPPRLPDPPGPARQLPAGSPVVQDRGPAAPG